MPFSLLCLHVFPFWLPRALHPNPKLQGRDLLTPQSRHWYALTGTFSGTPDVGVPRTVSCEQNYQFWIGQQPKPQICGCFSLHGLLPNVRNSITNNHSRQARFSIVFGRRLRAPVTGIVMFFYPLGRADTAVRSGSPRACPPENGSLKRSRRLALGEPEDTGLPQPVARPFLLSL